MTNNTTEQLVVNWHILEQCNFGCNYCFAHWQKPAKTAREIRQLSGPEKGLLSQILQLPRYAGGDWNGVRLNLAGGEPMLLWKQGRGDLDKIMRHADCLGFGLSIISNGYFMDDEFIRAWAPTMQIIGISVDSNNAGMNAQIGRCDNSGQQVGIERIADIFRLARQSNPDIECKLNTVVNAVNWRADMRGVLDKTKPDRWKVFKMLPVADTPEISGKQTPLIITDKQYQHFLATHAEFRRIMTSENNDEMADSYWMVDPWGRLYQNEPSDENYRHVHSDPVHEIGIKMAVEQLAARKNTNLVVDQNKYRQRYS